MVKIKNSKNSLNTKYILICLFCMIQFCVMSYSYAGEAYDLAYIIQINPIKENTPKKVITTNLKETSELQLAAQGLIRLYQKYVSSQDGPSCGFIPTCSHFGMACIREYGILRGVLLTADRLIRCNGSQSNHYHIDPISEKYIDPISDYAK